jgi:hypothetical protein
MAIGRPTAYSADIAEQCYRLALLGADRDQMADILLVSIGTFKEWLEAHDDLFAAVTRGRAAADAHIAQALYHRARGYSHPAVKIFLNKQGEPVIVPYTEHYPPDTMAAIFWLKNRRPDLWRDKQDIDMSINGKVSRLDDDDRTARAMRALDALVAGRPRPLVQDGYREWQAEKSADRARLPQVIDALATDGNSDTPAE